MSKPCLDDKLSLFDVFQRVLSRIMFELSTSMGRIFMHDGLQIFLYSKSMVELIYRILLHCAYNQENFLKLEIVCRTLGSSFRTAYEFKCILF